jgi:ribosomal protein L37E
MVGMVNKFINIFWNICEKPVRFNSRTKYDLELDSYLVNYSGDECIIEKLSTNLRRIRMESIGLFEEVKEKNKDDIENFLKVEFARKCSAYEKKRRKNKDLPTIEEIFTKVDLTLLLQLSIFDIVDKYLLALEMKEQEPLSPIDYYPEARKLNRHFIIHVGGTNTGKTYHSIKRLKEVWSGVYLGPLRLLAFEVQENLMSAGVKCSMVTGEERKIIQGANHISSTVEMLNLKEHYDVAVIDECQMIADKWRGGHWVKAILGVLSEEVHLCTAPEALDLLKELIELCEDTYEVVEHKRTVPLVFKGLSKNFDFKKDVRKGDALVVFSRKSVLRLAAELENAGKKASVIYGALPYDTRKLQMERFLNGETEVVVATDAIGMGLNLPIKRIIFMEGDKFDGETRRRLEPEEIKQIAGRAGRMGMYDIGIVSSFECKDLIKESLNFEIPQIRQCYLNFPEKLLDLNADIESILQRWYAQNTNSFFYKQEISELMTSLEYLKKLDMSKYEKHQVCTIAFDEDIQDLRNLWYHYCQQYLNGEPLDKPEVVDKDLFKMEISYKALDLYYGFAQKMHLPFDEDWVYYTKLDLSYRINQEILKTLKTNHKKCRRCGRNLPWNFTFNICQECFDALNKKRNKFYS